MAIQDEAKEKVQSFARSRIGLIVFTAIEFIVFLFTLIGTPIAQFVPVPHYWGNWVDHSCYTLWGIKVPCSSTKYSTKGDVWLWSGDGNSNCKQRKRIMAAAGALAIISICISFLIVICGALLIWKGWRQLFIPTTVMCIVTFSTLLVCWACVAGVYHDRMCKRGYFGINMKDMGYKLGPGFILILIAWILQLVNSVLMVVLNCL